MKISKTRLNEIIREEISEHYVRTMIRKKLKEFTSAATGLGGAKPKDWHSDDTLDARSKWIAQVKVSRDASQGEPHRYSWTRQHGRTATMHTGDTVPSSTAGKGGYTISNVTERPGWVTWNRNAQKQSAYADTLSNTYQDNLAKDLLAHIPKSKPPAGMSAAFGRGKSAGKGKGKGKGKKKN